MKAITNRFARRRLVNVLWLLLACGLLVMAKAAGDNGLYATEFFTGWTLFACIIGLTALNLRKKLPFLPVGRASLWLQLHIYTGFFALVAYWLHAGRATTHGYFETVLEALFLLVAVSGVVGLLLSRVLSRRLTRHGENLLYERMPGFIARLRSEVEELVLRAGAEHGSTAIPEFYTLYLRAFFLKPRNFWAHLLESRGPSQHLADKISALERYLDAGEREILGEIAERVETKHGLDYQYAAQSLLKWWLFLHIPFTYGLILFAGAHAVLVYAFAGSA
ncbi:MAG: hypothetical protein PVJ83_04210 [Gammaproteobacteria bacterium]|jgi:hypothetical protein